MSTIQAPIYDTPVGIGGRIDQTGQITSGPLSGQKAGTNLDYTYTPSSSINSTALTPTAPIQVTQPVPATQSAGLGGIISSNADAFTKNIANSDAAAKTANDTSLQALVKGLSGTPSQTQLTDSAYAATVDPLQKDLTDINQQIIAEDVATQHQIQAIKQNPQGLYGNALNQEIQKVQDASTARKADLSVIQMAKQGAYDGAKAIADRAVQAKFEQQQNVNAALQLTYQNNKDLFTTAEQRQFETVQADRNRQLDLETYKEKARYDQLIKQNSAGGGSTSYIGGPVAVVSTPTGTQPISTYTLQAGDDPYVIAQQNGTDMATLHALNPNITDWTKLPVGASINLPDSSNTWLAGKTPQQVQAFNAIPDAQKGSIQQLVTGDALLTDIVKSRGANTQGQINAIINQARSIDPSFSINTNKQRYAYKTQFNNPNGKEQLQINAINTGLGHLAEVKSAVDALNNGSLVPANQLANYLKKNTGDPKVIQANIAITALAGELASIYKGGNAPTDQETAEWRNNILASYSKDQTKGITDTTSSLISNKILSLNNSYKNVIGSYPVNPIINPDAIQQLQAVGVDTSAITSKLQKQGYSEFGSSQTPSGNDNNPLGI